MVIGAGGMGEVYLGVEEPIGRKVAIKLMRADLEKWRLQRFNDERKALASLNQRNIVVMLTSGEANHRHYLVMEYLEGESLGARLRRGPMAPSEVVEITVRSASRSTPRIVARSFIATSNRTTSS